MVKFKQTPQLKVVKSNTAVGELESAELVLSQIKVGDVESGAGDYAIGLEAGLDAYVREVEREQLRLLAKKRVVERAKIREHRAQNRKRVLGRPEQKAGTEKSVYSDPMSDLNRDELKAQLENQELKVDARLKEFEGRVADGLGEMNHTLQLLDRDLAGVRGIKGTIIINSIVSVIAIVGIVIGVMAYGVASFDSGRDTSQLLQEVRQQSFENKQLLEQIKASQQIQKNSQ
ncbi:hypothetical protein ACOAO4_30120 [Pseudomonas aeruginosa]